MPAGTTAGAPRRLLRRDERQAQLRRAAATAFAHAGYAATSMEDVAAAAGVTKLIVYRHFTSKEELYRSVLTGVCDRLEHEFAAVVSEYGGHYRPGVASEAMLRAARDNPDGFRLLTRHALREPEFAGIARQFLDDATALADSLIAELIPDPAVKAWAGRVIVEYLVQTVLSWLDVGDPDRDDELVDLATRGLRAMFLAWADRGRVEHRIRTSDLEDRWI